MTERIDWLPDGTPFSPRYGDRYHSSANHGLDQARRVFLHGNHLPLAWAHQPQWRVLETGFGLGLNFLVTWAAWRDDPARPQTLHFTSVEAHPVQPADILRCAPPVPQLRALAAELAGQLWGLLPGVHRISLDAGRVLLTLWVGDAATMLRQQRSVADSIYLDGFSPRVNPQMWGADTLHALARHCRTGTTLATWCVSSAVRRTLAEAGFVLEKIPGVPPKRANLRGQFAPAWTVRRAAPSPAEALPPPLARAGTALVTGAGLAGSAVAHSLARRGWRVLVLDAAAQPASGASALPGGLLCPSVSRDDNTLSRLSRCGVRLTLQRLAELLPPGEHWAQSGVLEHCVDGKNPLPADWPQCPPDGPGAEAGAACAGDPPHPALDWSHRATGEQLRAAHLPEGAVALWHRAAAWVRPAHLVAAQLAHPAIEWRGGCTVARLQSVAAAAGDRPQWQALAGDGSVLAQADIAIIATGAAAARLLPPMLEDAPSGMAASAEPASGPRPWPLRPLRGQITQGWLDGDAHAARAAVPPFPVNGHGNFTPLPDGKGGADGTARPALHWVMGSTFERGIDALPPTPAEQATAHATHLDKLRRLLPGAASALQAAFAMQDDGANTWAAVRCTSSDRLPLAGPLWLQPASPTAPPGCDGLWVLTALGARGLTLSVLCGELLAAQIMGEPLPLDAALAQRLHPRRALRPLP